MKKPTNLCTLILAACLVLPLCTCGDGAGETAAIRISIGGGPLAW